MSAKTSCQPTILCIWSGVRHVVLAVVLKRYRWLSAYWQMTFVDILMLSVLDSVGRELGPTLLKRFTLLDYHHTHFSGLSSLQKPRKPS